MNKNVLAMTVLEHPPEIFCGIFSYLFQYSFAQVAS